MIKRFFLMTFAICLLWTSAFAWNGPWSVDGVPYIKKAAAPTVADSSYVVPYMWVDTANAKFYLLIDNTAGAAVWQEVSYSGGIIDTLNLDQNVETLAATKTLVITDLVIQKLDPDGSDRDVVMSAEASSTDLVFWIYNAANGAGEDLTVKDDAAATIVSLGPGMGMMFSCDGTSWVAIGDDGITYDAVAESNTLDKLIIANTSEPAIIISMTGITGTDNQAIDIIGGEALDSEEHWTGIRVLPSDLDPGAADTRIRGIASNLSGVDVSNVPESMDALRLVMPDGRTLTGAARSACDALSIQDGDIDHFFAVPATAATIFTAYDISVDAGLLHTNSEIHAIDVSVAGGDPDGDVAAVSTGTYVAPIHQHIGAYSTPDQATPDAFAGHTSDGGSTWIDGIDGLEIFEKNADIVWIGSAAVFSNLDVIMTSNASKQIGLTWEYSTGASTWSSFGVDDDTDGFQQSGVISWTAANLVGWSNSGDPGAGDSDAGYWIRITRTSGPDPGTPTPTTIQTGAVVLYEWNEDGDLVIKNIDIAEYRIFPATLSDDTASGDIDTVTFGEDVVFGEVCYPDATDNEWKKSLGTNAAVTYPGMGIALESKGNGEAGKLLLRGKIRDDSAFAGEMGDIVYLSDGTAGDVLYAAPDTSGDIVQILGFVNTDNVFYFNPDYTYVEVP